MKQALHIFRKDVRHLWPQIVVTLVLVAGHAALDVLQKPIWNAETGRINGLAQFSSVLLVLAWWNLIAAVVYEEVLPGDRQFWVTRPYSWKSLLGAKVLFLLAFVNAPLLVSDCVVLAREGFPVVKNLPYLLLREPLVSSWLILPALALATVTSGLGQFVLALLIVFAGSIFESTIVQSFLLPTGTSTGLIGLGGNRMEMLLILVLLGGSLWQFAKRRTGWVRGVLAVSLFVIASGFGAIPWPRKDALETANRRQKVSELRIAYDLTQQPLRSNGWQYTQGATASALLPLLVTGLPDGTALEGRGEISIGARKDRVTIGALQRHGDNYFEEISMDAATLEQLRSRRVDLRTTFRVTVVTDEVRTRVPAQRQTMVIPGVGICEMYVRPSQIPSLSCRSDVRGPRSTLLSIAWPGYRSKRVHMGNLAAGRELLGGLSPVQKWVTPLDGLVGTVSYPMSPSQLLDALSHPRAELLFTPQWPLAETTLNVNAENVDLSPYFRAQ